MLYQEAIKYLFYTFWQTDDVIHFTHFSCLFLKATLLTGGDRAHHHSAEFDDGAEDVFGLSGARQILTVAF